MWSVVGSGVKTSGVSGHSKNNWIILICIRIDHADLCANRTNYSKYPCKLTSLSSSWLICHAVLGSRKICKLPHHQADRKRVRSQRMDVSPHDNHAGRKITLTTGMCWRKKWRRFCGWKRQWKHDSNLWLSDINWWFKEKYYSSSDRYSRVLL